MIIARRALDVMPGSETARPLQDIVLHELQASTSFSWSQILGEEFATRLFYDTRLSLMNKAASHGYTATALRLLRTGFHPGSGHMLHSAVIGGHLGVVVALLQWRADVNLNNYDKCRTPLHMAALRAAENSDWQLHSTLVDYGADQNAEDELGKTPATLAQDASLSAAAFHGNTDAILKLLMLRCDPNARGSAWRTECWRGRCESPLSLATKGNYSDAVRILLANGADANIDEPLRRAVERGNQEIVSLLLHAGANSSVTRRRGSRRRRVDGHSNNMHEESDSDTCHSDHDSSAEDAVRIAIRRGHATVVQAFLDAGVVSSSTPLLHYALERMYECYGGGWQCHPHPKALAEPAGGVVAVLLNANADPNESVPIHLRYDSNIGCFLDGVPLNLVEGDSQLTRMLLEAGADPSLVDRFYELAAAKHQYFFDRYV